MAKVARLDLPVTFIRRGVPRRLTYEKSIVNYELFIRRIEFNAESASNARIIKPDKQVRQLRSLLKHPLKSNCVIGLSGQSNDRIAIQVAFKIFVEAYLNSRNTALPYWHVVYGNVKDKLWSDNEDFQFNIGGVSLLVLSNVAMNSTSLKIEKIRDILEIYSSIPRVVVVSGGNPIDFFSRILYYKLDIGINFGDLVS